MSWVADHQPKETIIGLRSRTLILRLLHCFPPTSFWKWLLPHWFRAWVVQECRNLTLFYWCSAGTNHRSVQWHYWLFPGSSHPLGGGLPELSRSRTFCSDFKGRCATVIHIMTASASLYRFLILFCPVVLFVFWSTLDWKRICLNQICSRVKYCINVSMVA